MFINNVVFTDTELNTAVKVIKTITDKSFTTTDGITVQYRPTSIKVENTSGSIFSYGLFTSTEYTKYLSDNTYSDLMVLHINEEDILSTFSGEISTIVVSGTTGHISGVTFEVHQQ